MRFERQARLLQQLDHPHIVSLIDIGHQDHHPYLVMDYHPWGWGTLKARVGSQVAWWEAAQLLAPLAQALDYAHSRGILQRDIKPSNLLDV
jgi:serine/threonine protein kinase